jgi:hypothetical protein
MRTNLPLAFVATLALAASASAQHGFGYTQVDTQKQLGPMAWDENIPTWVAPSADGTQMVGGSLRTNKSSVITGAQGLQLLQVGRVPLIANENNTGNYYGLNLYGDWVPLSLTGPAATTHYGQDLFGLTYGGKAYVFGNWSTQWRKIDLKSQQPAWLAGRACLMLRDGPDLYGFSTLFQDQPALLSVPATALISPIPGIGESESRRNFQCYEVGTTKAAIYSAYTNRWWTIDLGAPITSLTFDYDKNSLLILDPTNNKLWSYSALTGVAIPRFFKDLSNVQTNVQDFGITIVETGGDILYFRAADTQYSLLPGRANDLVTGGGHANNHWSIALNDPTTSAIDYWACSSSYRNASFVRAGLTPSETVLYDDDNDCVTVVVTDKALYGYSAFTNQWTVVRNYKGTFAKGDAEDFIGRVNTDTHAYAFSPRDDKWFEVAISGNAKVADIDQAVIVTEPNEIKILGMQALDWRVQKTTGTVFQAGNNLSYHYSIHDNAKNGSTVYFYQCFADRWFSEDLSNKVSDPANVIELEDGILIVDGTTVHAFSAFGDLSSNWAAPNDNAAYHAVPGAFARFTATGRPAAAAVLLIGADRLDLALPGIMGELQINPTFILPLPIGVYGQDGTVRFNVQLVGVGQGKYRFQMLGLDPQAGFEFGRLLDFQVF